MFNDLKPGKVYKCINDNLYAHSMSIGEYPFRLFEESFLVVKLIEPPYDNTGSKWKKFEILLCNKPVLATITFNDHKVLFELLDDCK
jgi:hypothetical protein